jgi:hypothetical protein
VEGMQNTSLEEILKEKEYWREKAKQELPDYSCLLQIINSDGTNRLTWGVEDEFFSTLFPGRKRKSKFFQEVVSIFPDLLQQEVEADRDMSEIKTKKCFFQESILKDFFFFLIVLQRHPECVEQGNMHFNFSKLPGERSCLLPRRTNKGRYEFLVKVPSDGHMSLTNNTETLEKLLVLAALYTCEVRMSLSEYLSLFDAGESEKTDLLIRILWLNGKREYIPSVLQISSEVEPYIFNPEECIDGFEQLSFEEFVSVVSVIPKELECGSKFEYHSALSWEGFWKHAGTIAGLNIFLQKEIGERLSGELSWENLWKHADDIAHFDGFLQKTISKRSSS